MAINNLEAEFPCGLKIKLYAKSIWLEMVHTFDDIQECPLHGKECWKKNRSQK